MGHEWHTLTSKSIIGLINEFNGYQMDTNYGGIQKVSNVRITDRIFPTEDETRIFITRSSYGGNTAYIAAYTTKKLSKAYQNAFSNFKEKYKEYTEFRNNLTIAYGRTASKVTCPECGSSINLRYGKRFKNCPICGSNKIISDSNWKTLNTKRRMCEKAGENLKKEAEKNDVTFICGIEWHC